MASGSWFRALGELVLPRACGGCGAQGTWWCSRCAVAVTVAGAPPPSEFNALGVAFGCHSAAWYHGPVGPALVAMKERGVAGLIPPLADLVTRAAMCAIASARAAGEGRIVIVPAPSRSAVVRARGSDVLADLARAVADRLRDEGADITVLPCLTYTRRVADQAGLDATARAHNLAGALRVRSLALPLLADRTVLVIDDVVTTGATLAEAARAICTAVPAVDLVAATIAAA